MSKVPLLLAAGAGYVLGAKAGRERYEQIARSARRVAKDPRVESAAGKAASTVKDTVAEHAPFGSNGASVHAGTVTP